MTPLGPTLLRASRHAGLSQQKANVNHVFIMVSLANLGTQVSKLIVKLVTNEERKSPPLPQTQLKNQKRPFTCQSFNFANLLSVFKC